jgi:two-component system, NtrC family, sensor histidine kinase PilS
MNTATAGAESNPAPLGDDTPESFWRALSQLNHFRLFVAFTLGVVGIGFDNSYLNIPDPSYFVAVCVSYFLVAWIFILPMQHRVPSFEAQLVRHVFVDIVCMGMLLYLSVGGPTGLGLLLIVSMAAVGMLKQKRKVLFWAALAAMVLLSQQLLLVLEDASHLSTLARGGALAASFFGVALLSNVQASSVRLASRMVQEKTTEAENLTRVNARMIQELPYAVMAVDGQGNVLQFNSRVETLLDTRFFARCNLRQCSPPLAALWSQWRHMQDIPEHPLQTGRDGRRFIPRFIELEPSRREGAIVVLEDMTDLEAQAQRMKLASLGMLTANLAHEIRNPLSAIRHAAGLLREDADAAADAGGSAGKVAGRLTRIIDDNAERLNSLVEDVLALNRRDRQRREDLVLAMLVPRFVLDFCQREHVPEDVVQIHLTGDPHLCMDADQLEQILWNLLRNAWRYCSKQPGSIRLRISALRDQIDIDVINDGPPISADTRARLFEPFYTTSKQGTGLGLYIARDLAEANGASLRYMDTPDGVMFRLSSALQPCKEVPEHLS